MPVATTAVSLSIIVEDKEALDRAIIRFAAAIIDELVQEASAAHIREEFKFPVIISGRPIAAYLESMGRNEENFLVVTARATTFSSPIEGTVYLVKLVKTSNGWAVRSKEVMPISSD